MAEPARAERKQGTIRRAGKQKPAKKHDPNQIAAAGLPNEDEADFLARTVLRPTVQAAVTLQQFGKNFGTLNLSGLTDALTVQTKLANDGDLARGEAMLTTQAHTLDAIYNNLARRAINAEYMDNLDRYLKLALRAQSQCRATWETLATMKNPPMMGYVKQANISQGHQQVNNAPSGDSSRARENSDLQSKLLEAKSGERLDIGAAGAPGRADPAMATLGEGDRTKDAGG